MKTRIRRTFLLWAVFLLCILGANAQSNYFKIASEYRLRSEFRNGYRTLLTDSSKSAFFVGQRARLIFDHQKDSLRFYTSIQDARTWGDEEQRKDLAGLQVNELWAEMRMKHGFSLKMGRQELAYDDHRILGNLDWANLTISHDALLLKYTNNTSKLKIHLGAAFNQMGEPIFGTKYTLKNYKALGFSWLRKEFEKGHSLSILAVVNGLNSTVASSPKMKASYTIGPLYKYNANGWSGVLGIYYQGGKSEANLNQKAFMLNAYAEKKIKQAILGLGYDYLSGNSDKTKATDNQNFNTLYATNHKFYGYMDYFLAIPSDAKQRGLVDLYARLGYEHSNKLSGSLYLHQLSLANANHTGTTAIEKSLGTETDLLLDYKPSPLIHLQMGYSMMFATSNMELIKGGNANVLNNWVYVMLKFSPVLLYNEIKN